ncbi:DHA2 family methylenomycin A resistance protein-like MFS transporter [Actinoallomurus bryophytorum]|uniref:DHA2 family methylenomycin A resistance protein-like MFS transporter n=1 Tax=Actinoallomurus bryophytorum TaxID=1490222 RepID=A0A543BZD5_9ACTN|nr:MFS transporter [Actinoallomurus bryophytorum]TQL90188.1 DHA2 family methylenomycin A resistance protein-like MFS transporter [Actinoallomurus bryophytorum]
MTVTMRERNASPTKTGRLPLAAVCLGYFLVILDVTVVTVAISAIGTDLRAGLTALQWVVDGYTLAFAGLLLFCGGLGDRLGGKPVFLAGLVVFTAASAGCGLAPSAGVLIGARLVQGAGAAAMVPASLALLRNAYPDRGSRARAFGVWGMVAGIAAGAGPVLGGVLVFTAGWRWVFFVNIPFGVLGFLLTMRYVPAPSPVRGRAGPDVPAQLTGALCVGGLTCALVEAGARGWTSPVVLGGLGLFVLALPAFLLLETRSRAPMLPLTLFGGRRFRASAVIGVLLNLGFYGLLFVVPLYFQRVQHLSPLMTGLAMLPMAMMPLISSPLSGRIAARTGPHPPMAIGLVIGGAGLLGWLLAGPDTSYWTLVAPMTLSGFGTGLTMPAATSAIMEAAPAELGGAASAVFNAARQTGSAIGVALVGTLVAGGGLVAGLHADVIVGGLGFLAAAALTVVTIRP